MDVYREIIDQVRESRRQMSKACGHNMAEYVAYLRSFNTKYSEQVARFQSQRSHSHPSIPAPSSE